MIKILLTALLLILFTSDIFSQSWTAPVKVSSASSINVNPGLAIDSNNVYHVVWAHKVSPIYWIILHSQSIDEGSSWSEADTVLNIPDAWLYETHIVCYEGDKLVVSFDSISWGGTYTQVYAMMFDGVTWSYPFKLSSANNAKGNKLIVDHANRVFCFWHELYNGNTKFMYRVFEDGQWGETVIPYSDSNVYVLENIDVDADNNLHGIGYFNYDYQTSDDMSTTYYLYEKYNNQWAPPYFLSINLPYRGCDIVADTMLLPQTVFSDYIQMAPLDFGTIHRKQDNWGWGIADTVSAHKEEIDPRIEISSENKPDFIISELIPHSYDVVLKDYYQYDEAYSSKEIDSNGSIILPYILNSNARFNLVYAKLPLYSGWDNYICYTAKSLNVGYKENDAKVLTIIFPNPCKNEINISVFASNTSTCNISLQDMFERRMFEMNNVKLLAGNNLIPIKFNSSINKTPSRLLCYLVLTSDKFKIVQPIIIIN